MRIKRRDLMVGTAALAGFAALPKEAHAWLNHGATALPKGWNTLPIGWGGLTTGFNIAPDGTALARTDVNNIYLFSGKLPADKDDPKKMWEPLINYESMSIDSSCVPSGSGTGGLDAVIAPTLTTRFYVLTFRAGKRGTQLYYSNDSGQHWIGVPAVFAWNPTRGLGRNYVNDISYKSYPRKIAVDPQNENVVYCGLPDNCGNTYQVYVASDGATFNPATTNGSTAFPMATAAPGCCNIIFDDPVNTGTTTYGGITYTSHLLIPITGQGIFETKDGGQNFTEIAAAGIGTSNVLVYSLVRDADTSGIFYFYLKNNVTNSWQLWRYNYNNGVSSRWAKLRLPSPSWAGEITLATDPRKAGHLYYSHGINWGFKTTDARITSPTWTGGSPTVPILSADYEPRYLTQQGYGYNMWIDTHGYAWSAGGQCGLQWVVDNTSNDPILPDWTTSFSVQTLARGHAESAVPRVALRAPGGTNAVTGCQDIGLVGGNTWTNFAQFAVMDPTMPGRAPGYRCDCSSVCYAPFRHSFMAVRMS